MSCVGLRIEKRIERLQVDGNGVKGRPKKRWREVLREDMR